MKHRLATVVIASAILLTVAIMLFPQGSGYNSYQTNTFTAVAVGTPSIFQNSLIKYHQLIWTVTGTVTSCTVALDTSPDNVTFAAGGAIAGQTCTSNGSSSITGIVSANYVRVNMTAFVGTGSVVVVYEGWAYNPSGAAAFPLLAPDGTVAAPSYAFTNATGTGISRNGTNLVFGIAGTAVASINSQAGFEIINGDFICWSSSTDPTGSCDTTLSKVGSKVIYIGTSGDDSGFFRGAQCRITSDITLPVNTATTVCSLTLPVSLAKPWAWQCQLPWVISAGTGTNTLAIGVNLSSAPTGTTNGFAEIKTTNANVATEGSAAISASGATTLLTSGTITPNAAFFMSSTSGTVLLPAAANTFSIQMTAAGTTATAAAKAGGTCQFY